MDLYNKIQEAQAFVRSRTQQPVEVGLVLGSGLGGLADSVENAVHIPYLDIPHLAPATVMGHAGELVVGHLEGVQVVVMKGRLHYYEGYTMEQVTFPTRLIRSLGADTLIVTNSCGGLNPSYVAGDMMLIRDHINHMGDNPLIGPNDDRLGPRFPPMSRAYPQDMRQRARAAAAANHIQLQEGVYLGLTGPSFETPAEILSFQRMGADALGMSTVPEVIVANHMGMKVLGLACVTNVLHDGPSNDTHVEVLDMAARTSAKMLTVLRASLQSMAREKR
ncbi:purine-nucleoside phosphorylase [bacterium]|nr:purine-nucleoside phosphorylase [bacterium]